MPLTVAAQMDPIERIRIAGDSTFALLLEAQARGHRILHYTPDRLRLNGTRVEAMAEPLTVKDVEGDHARLGEAKLVDLSTVDVVLLRQDPPFDLAYIATTHLLERIHPQTLVVNDPRGVRDSPEKLFVMDFPELMPPTLIARDKAAIEAFRAEHGEVVMKPLYGFGGASVRTRISARSSTCSARASASRGSSRSSCRRSRAATSESFSWMASPKASSTAFPRATIFVPTWCAADQRKGPS
jgi:glutathione synthase